MPLFAISNWTDNKELIVIAISLPISVSEFACISLNYISTTKCMLSYVQHSQPIKIVMVLNWFCKPNVVSAHTFFLLNTFIIDILGEKKKISMWKPAINQLKSYSKITTYWWSLRGYCNYSITYLGDLHDLYVFYSQAVDLASVSFWM